MNATEWAAGVGVFLGELLLVITVAGSLTALILFACWRISDAIADRREYRQAHHDLAAAEMEWRRREQLSATWPSDAGAPE